MAYSEKPLDNATKLPSSISHRATYLLEELLPVNQPFRVIKYIHNADAVPLQERDEPGYEFGVFLCFIQHVKFTVCIHGQAYISDSNPTSKACGLYFTFFKRHTDANCRCWKYVDRSSSHDSPIVCHK